MLSAIISVKSLHTSSSSSSSSSSSLMRSMRTALRLASDLSPSTILDVAETIKTSQIGIGTWAWGDKFFWGYEDSQDEELFNTFQVTFYDSLFPFPFFTIISLYRHVLIMELHCLILQRSMALGSLNYFSGDL